MNVRLYQKRKKSRPATKLKKIITTSGGTQVDGMGKIKTPLPISV